jgi:hypothetical protein
VDRIERVWKAARGRLRRMQFAYLRGGESATCCPAPGSVLFPRFTEVANEQPLTRGQRPAAAGR